MLRDRIETGPNALNAIRLALASDVVMYHAWQHLGGSLPWAARQAMGELPVDAFFTISGFLIARSWQHRPNPRAYLIARASRILPGLWACLIVTAFVVVPVAGIISGQGVPTLASRLGYVANNAGVLLRQTAFDGGPNVGRWDGQLWSLAWESGCYLTLLMLGVLALLSRRFVTGLFATFAMWGLLVLTQSPVHAGWLYSGSRLSVMFSAGMLMWAWGDRIRLDGRLAALAAVVLAGSFLTWSYWAIAAVPVAYLCLYVGISLGRYPTLRLPNDVSYGVYIYGSPILGLLYATGATLRPWPVFGALAIACTLPVAAASWFGVERPAMRWAKRRVKRPQPAPEPVAA